MNEEIKVILDKLRSDDYYEKEYQKSVYYERDLKKLEYYITNLKEELTKHKILVNKIYACINNNQIFLNEDEGNILDEKTIEYILKLIEEIDEDNAVISNLLDKGE